MDKDKIKQAFGRAAVTYDSNAYVQKIASDKLVSLSKMLPCPNHICEIGCGTGYLTSRVIEHYKRATYLATDISEEMIKFCKEKFKDNSQLNFKVEDGEKIKLDYPLDWIISNFTFQWFEKQIEAIQTLYQNSQFLIFTTLLDGTFKEWKEICKQFWLADKVLYFLDEEAFVSQIQLLNPYYLSIETEKEFYPTPLSFLMRLKGIGAHKTFKDEKKINIHVMRKILENRDSLEISYRVAYCILKNDKIKH